MIIAVLGAVRVTVDGDVVMLRRKERELLAALVLQRGSFASDEDLIEALWGASSPPNAAKSLQVHMARLRAAVGRTEVARVDGGYRLASSVEIDVDTFERVALDSEASADDLRAGLDSWRGDPYEELAGWPIAATAIRHLGELRCLTEERWAESLLASRGPRYTLPMLERLAAGQPLRERRWTMLAHALMSEGRNVEALRTVQRARDVLLETAGLDPGAELLQIERDILGGNGQQRTTGVVAERMPSALGVESSQPADEPSVSTVSNTSQSERLKRSWPKMRIGVSVGLVVALGLAVAVALRSDPRGSPISASSESSIRTSIDESTVIAGPATVITGPATEATPGSPPASAAPSVLAVSSTSVAFDPTTAGSSPSDSVPVTRFGGATSDPTAHLRDISCDDVAQIATAPADAQGPRTAATRCAELTVLQRRDDPAGPRVALVVVTEPAADMGRSDAPVLTVGEFRSLSRPTPGDHIVLVARGAPGSTPTLDCPEMVAPWVAAIGPAGPTGDALVAAASACADRLAAAGVDVAAFDSEAVADDVADLARLLGIEHVHLEVVGAAGTQVAERLVERHHSLVASVVAQDPQPSGVALVDVMPGALARTWHRYVELCAGDPSCAATYPELGSSWDALQSVLTAQPLQLTLEGNPPVDVRVDGRLMQLALTDAFDIPGSMPLIAGLIANGDADIGGRFIAATVERSASADGVRLAHLCIDEDPYRNVAVSEVTRRLAGPFAAVADWFEMIEAPCSVWPHDDPTSPALPNSVPMLAVYGGMSPYLADDWAVRLERSWPTVRSITLPTVTFGTNAAIPACLDEILTDWWTDPSSIPVTSLVACEDESPPIAFAGVP